MNKPSSSLIVSALLVLPFALAACSGDDTNTAAPPSPEAGTTPDASMHVDGSTDGALPDAADAAPDAPATADAGDAAVPYPAVALPLPQVRTGGGPTLATPRIVPVFYASDDSTMKDEITAYIQGLPATDYWKNAAKEYGVTGATVATPVIVTDPAPTTIDDSAIQPWIAAYLAAAAPGADAGTGDAGSSPWPAADENSIYIVFYPAGTTVTLSSGPGQPASQSCTDFGAYHSEDPLDDGSSTPYAVIPRCNGYLGQSGIDFVTAAASHELMEASTDPFVNSDPAYNDTDFNGSGWDLNSGGPEIGDLCKLETDSDYKPAAFDYLVQRMWSDEAAAGGHEPCVPNLPGAGPYFNAFPNLEGIEAYPGYYVSGVNVQPGTSRTIPIYLVSDAPTSGPWTVSATEQGSPQAPPDPDHLLSFTWDKTTGQNGDVLHLTIKRAATPATTGTHGLPLVLSSTLGTQTNSWWTIVGE